MRHLKVRRHLRKQINGMGAEERFMSAWDARIFYPPWLARVRRATDTEDRREKTDAVMTTRDGKTIRIQIKSYVIPADEVEKLVAAGIVPLYIGASYSLELIRTHTIAAIERFNGSKPVHTTSAPRKRFKTAKPTNKSRQSLKRSAIDLAWDVPEPDELGF